MFGFKPIFPTLRIVPCHKVISCSTVSLTLNNASSASSIFIRTVDSGLKTIFLAVAFVPDDPSRLKLPLSVEFESIAMTVCSELNVDGVSKTVGLSVADGSEIASTVFADSVCEGFVSGMMNRPDGEVRRKSGRTAGDWR